MSGDATCYYPEYGSVGALLGLLPVLGAAGVMTDVFAARAPGVPVGVLAAMALWGLLALVLVAEFRRQAAANPRTFENGGSMARFCREGRPGGPRLLLALSLALGGGFLASQLWGLFLDAAERVALGLVALPDAPAAAILNDALGLVVFAVIYGTFAYGVDRLLLGVLRMFVHHNVVRRAL